MTFPTIFVLREFYVRSWDNFTPEMKQIRYKFWHIDLGLICRGIYFEIGEWSCIPDVKWSGFVGRSDNRSIGRVVFRSPFTYLTFGLTDTICQRKYRSWGEPDINYPWPLNALSVLGSLVSGLPSGLKLLIVIGVYIDRHHLHHSDRSTVLMTLLSKF